MKCEFSPYNNEVIQIEVGEGSYKPYYLKSRVMKPSGVYIRQGASSVQASSDQIRRMIKDSDGDVFEEMRAAPHRSDHQYIQTGAA
ncbi:MAG: ATP-binding protein [Lachnospiraceae bacterium]|nr:ATP-binding protein [Lachnospiraceae bacterium]